jgi:MFS family permease
MNQMSKGHEQIGLFSKATIYGWIFFTLAGCFFLYEFFLRSSMGAMEDIFRHDLGTNSATVAFISSAYFLAYSIMQIPVGILIDKFGVRKMGTVAVLVTAVGCLLFSMSHTVMGAWWGRFGIGFGSAFAFVMMFKIILDWFPGKYLGFMGGMTQVLGIIGPILAGAPFAYALTVTNDDWRGIFHIVVLIGVVLAIVYWLVVRDKIKSNISDLDVKPKEHTIAKLKKLIKIKQLWAAAVFAFFVYPAIEVIGSLFGVPFMQHHGFSLNDAAGSVSFVWLGLGLGSPFVGWISDRLQKRKPVLTMCAVFGALITLAIVWGGMTSLTLFSGLFFLLGVATGAQTLSFTIVVENVPRELEGTAVGFNNMFVLMGAAIGQMFSGWMLHYSQGAGGVHNLLGYQIALSVCVGSFVVAILLSHFFIKETACKRQYPY